jgi:aspartyl-tRNA(Asn)/glutamyl-tRNA(Gln) amidotransferase subunit A
MTACATVCATCPQGAGLQDMYAATRADGLRTRRCKRRIMIGTYVLSAGFYDAYYTQAQKVRTLIAQRFRAGVQAATCMLAPTAPSAAFGLGEKTGRSAVDVFERRLRGSREPRGHARRCRSPRRSNRDGLPLGLQIIGKAFDEQGVLNAELAIEQRAGSRRSRSSGGSAAKLIPCFGGPISVSARIL